MFNHFPHDTPTPWLPEATLVPADVQNTDTLINTLLEQSTQIQVKQAKQFQSLCNILAMSKALIEGMNLILHQLNTIDPCPPPPQSELVQPPTHQPDDGQSGQINN